MSVDIAARNNIYVCSMCSAEFEAERQLLDHLIECQSGSNQNAVYGCQLCSNVFTTMSAVEYHIKEAHKDIISQLEAAQLPPPPEVVITDERQRFSEPNPDLENPACLNLNDVMVYEQVEADEESLPVIRCSFCNEVFPSDIHLSIHVDAVHLFNSTNKTNPNRAFANSTRVPNRKSTNAFGSKNIILTRSSNSDSRRSEIEAELKSTKLSTVFKKLPCDLCPRIFSTHHHLMQHVRARHSSRAGARPHPCITCCKRFSSLHHLNQHMVSVHSDKNYVCHICGRRFGKESYLTQHIQVSHSRGTLADFFTCEICEKVCSTRHHLNQHRQAHKISLPKKFLCLHCPKSFYNQEQLSQHMVIAGHSEAGENSDSLNDESENFLCCSICSKQFADEIKLTKHLISIHNVAPAEELNSNHGEEDEVAIDVDNLIDSTQELYIKKKHTVCAKCGKTFTSMSGLLYHIQNISCRVSQPLKGAIDGHRPFNCDLCGKAFKTRSHLNQHFRYHTGNR